MRYSLSSKASFLIFKSLNNFYFVLTSKFGEPEKLFTIFSNSDFDKCSLRYNIVSNEIFLSSNNFFACLDFEHRGLWRIFNCIFSHQNGAGCNIF